MHHARDLVLSGSSAIELEHFEEAYFSKVEVYGSTTDGFIPMVCVYKVNYD